MGSVRYNSWLFSHVHVPGRPNLTFTGQVGDIWWVFVLLGLTIFGAYDNTLQLISIPVQVFLSWLSFKWLVAISPRTASRSGFPFPASVGYVGWHPDRHLLHHHHRLGMGHRDDALDLPQHQGTRREIVFTGTGLEMLWRTIVMTLLSC